ncbi:MAG TPA: adenylate/guanylate cyclase domain-containing protein [Acidimicrobiia bacterium]|nr:adenylate/guanylate cyclase domain-containing protein [Acidimicrobiia bacterium]
MPARQYTFVFTDIEASTRLWLDHPITASTAIALHDDILTGVFKQFGGRIVKNLGDGLLAAFSDPVAGIEATAAGQRSLADRGGDLGGAGIVRMGVHSGVADARGDDLVGLEVNRCQRIMACAHGGQVLVSATTADLAADRLPSDLTLMDLGEYQLPSLDEPQTIHQLAGSGLRRDFPPLNSPTTATHNLPAELSSFVGRSQELADLDKLIRSNRLVTLTGEGGIGKTRLALRSASMLRGLFPDGIWAIELSSVTNEGGVSSHVAGSLGIRPAEGSLLEAITEHFRPLRTLLVLDNCEHVLSDVVALVVHLSRRCPDLTILTTSRERIGVPGEIVHRVPPMMFPDSDVSAVVAPRYDAVRLFVERANLVAPGFRLDETNVQHVSEICRRLDGLPLAIELAAAKSASITPAEMAGGLAHNLDLLDRRGPDGDRHRTLRAAARWSVQLLDPNEQLLFKALSVFRGGFDTDAVAAVTEQEQTEVLAGMSSLADKSLIRRHPTGARFQMLEPLRVFAGEELAGAPAQGVHDRHALYFADLAEEAFRAKESDRLGRWLDQLEADQDNIHAALEWSLEEGQHAVALRLATGASVLWKQRGQGAEGRRRLERALAVDGGADSLRARGHFAAGDLAADIGEIASAREHLQTALRLGRELGDKGTAAWSLARLASIPHKEGDLATACDLFEEALAAARVAGDDLILSHVLASLSLVVADRGDVERAGRLADESIVRSRATANTYAVADALLAAGEITLNHGSVADARRRIEEALEIGTREGLGTVIAWSLAYLGRASVVEGELMAGRVILEKAVEEFERAGTPMGRPWAMRHLAVIDWLLGEPASAEATLRDALTDAVAYVRPEAPLIIETYGWVLATSAPRSAAVLLACATAHLGVIGLELAPFEAAHAVSARRLITEALTGEERTALMLAGSQLDLTEAGRLAAARTDPIQPHSSCL